MDELELIKIKNGNNIKYFCNLCNIMLAEIEDNKVKSYSSCKHLRLERFTYEFYNHRFIGLRKVIVEDNDYFYLLIPNDKD
jgi:hypothetical protein